MKVEGNAIRLKFTHVTGGLVAKDGDLKTFIIAGKDGKFVPATARIDQDTLVVSSPDVARTCRRPLCLGELSGRRELLQWGWPARRTVPHRSLGLRTAIASYAEAPMKITRRQALSALASGAIAGFAPRWGLPKAWAQTPHNLPMLQYDIASGPFHPTWESLETELPFARLVSRRQVRHLDALGTAVPARRRRLVCEVHVRPGPPAI